MPTEQELFLSAMVKHPLLLKGAHKIFEIIWFIHIEQVYAKFKMLVIFEGFFTSVRKV